MPEDWANPQLAYGDYGIAKYYLDGVQVIVPYIEDADEVIDYETYFQDGSLHFEVGLDEGGGLSGHSTFIQDGWLPQA